MSFWRAGRGYGAGDKTVEQLSAPPASAMRTASGYRLVDVVDVVLDQLRDYYAERNPGLRGNIAVEQEWALKIGLITPGDWDEISDAVRTRTCVLVETAFQPRQRDIIRHFQAMKSISTRMHQQQRGWREARTINANEAAVLDETRRIVDE